MSALGSLLLLSALLGHSLIARGQRVVSGNDINPTSSRSAGFISKRFGPYAFFLTHFGGRKNTSAVEEKPSRVTPAGMYTWLQVFPSPITTSLPQGNRPARNENNFCEQTVLTFCYLTGIRFQKPNRSNRARVILLHSA